MARIVVVGGGLSGLSLVHYLKKFSQIANKPLKQITLLESSKRLGGCIETKRHNDGVLHEMGPRSIRFNLSNSGKNTLALIDTLGLTDDLLLVHAKNKAAGVRYIYCDGQLIRLPSGLLKTLLARIPGTKKRFFTAIKAEIKTPKLDITKYEGQDLSCHEFIRYRFGEEMADQLLDPVMRGITSGDCRKLSVKSNFKEFFEKEQMFGSIVKGLLKPTPALQKKDDEFNLDINGSISLKRAQENRTTSYNLKKGLESLTETLCDSIMSNNFKDTNVQIYNQSPVKSLAFLPDTNEWDVHVQTLDGNSVNLRADHIFAALPSNHLANILSMESELHKNSIALVQTKLKEIPFAPVACVCLEYRGVSNVLPPETKSFGFLTQSTSGSKVLGISYDSVGVPGHDNGQDVFRMTAMIGGAWYKKILGTDDIDSVPEERYIAMALDEIKKILGFSVEPQRVTVKVWKDGIAQYHVGHQARLDSIRKHIDSMFMPITLLGQSYDGISINDVIFSSRNKAYEFVHKLPMI